MASTCCETGPWVRSFIVGTGLAIALLGCAALDAAAVAETHRLDEAPYYVDLSPPPSERRGELPGTPLKLDVACDNIVAQLTRGTVIVPAR